MDSFVNVTILLSPSLIIIESLKTIFEFDFLKVILVEISIDSFDIIITLSDPSVKVILLLPNWILPFARKSISLSIWTLWLLASKNKNLLLFASYTDKLG